MGTLEGRLVWSGASRGIANIVLGRHSKARSLWRLVEEDLNRVAQTLPTTHTIVADLALQGAGLSLPTPRLKLSAVATF